MKTRWTDQVNDHPLPEYPRPQFKRNSYVNLNGWWDCLINCEDKIPASFPQKILVPFSPEASLSGVGHILQPEETLWYRRTFSIEEGFDQGRILLHFGAVDQECTVFVNGEEIGSHLGGYYSFVFDITDQIREENEIIVRVRDYTDTRGFEYGKQHLEPGRIWYTAQSGIWQTVWLESVPERHLSSVKMTPDLENRRIHFCFETEAENPLIETIVSFQGKEVIRAVLKKEDTIVLPQVHEWSPEHPDLYDVTFRFGNDEVESYFAMRSVSVGKTKDGHDRIFLNGKPYFLNGLLDQGYWPDGLYTAPCEEAMLYDIKTCKELGFNTLRKHIKIEPLRWYYLCDKYGMLVIQDMVNGGKDQCFWYKMLFQLFRGPIKDDERHYKGFGRLDPFAREQFQNNLQRMVCQLYNSPCIVVWTPFNEGWGQFESRLAYELIRKHDKSRLIDHASGWHDQGIGDLDSHHRYILKIKVNKDKRGKNRPYVLTEFGGYELKIKGHSFSEDEVSGHHVFQDADTMNETLKDLYQKHILGNVEKGLSACIYTQVADIENEVNGIMTYDREVLKLKRDTLAPIFDQITDYYNGKTASTIELE